MASPQLAENWKARLPMRTCSWQIRLPEAQDGEFLAAQASGHVAVIAQFALEHPPNGTQRLIARVMAIGIIDLLEVIQIEQDQAIDLAALMEAVIGLFAALAEDPAVGHAGQIIGETLGFQLCIRRLERPLGTAHLGVVGGQ